MAENKTPLCPRCGEPARYVLVKSGFVRFQLLPDGTLGKAISASVKHTPMETYECGGGHEWRT